MAIVIKSIGDLTKILESRMVKALELTRDDIFKVVSQKVFDYYEEPVFGTKQNPDPTRPEYYDRTGKLMSSLSASHVKKNGSNYEFIVGWDRDYLTFRYPTGFGNSTYNGITGLQVLKSFDSGTHGYTVPGFHNYFQEAIMELGGQEGIRNRFKDNLKKCGINVK